MSSLLSNEGSHFLLDCEFEYRVKVSPHSVALVSEDGSRKLTFQELSDLVNGLQHMITFNVLNNFDYSLEGNMISILTSRDFGMIVSILAILKSGCSYVPVDPTFPPDRQSYIFSHSKSVCLVADNVSYENASKLGVKFPTTIIIDASTGIPSHILHGANINKNDKDNESSRFQNRSGDDVAYVLYTSGSTGRPKGVMVTHANTLNCIHWFKMNLKVKSNDRILALATYCFDISVLEFFLALLSGASLIIATSETQRDPYRIISILMKHNISIMQATPTTYEMLLAIGWTGDSNIQFIVSFKQ